MLQLRSETRSERLLGLARLRMAIMVRASGVQKALERQTEVPMHVRQSARLAPARWRHGRRARAR